MKKIRVILKDKFSESTDTKEIELTDEKYESIEGAMKHKTVFSVFNKKTQIRYEWQVKEIEILN